VGKARKVAKYGAAGAATVLYGSSIYTVLTQAEVKKAEPHRVVIAASVMIGLTWIATTL
jgi:hypothetical protein